jgi:hypothetical protein
VKTPSEVRTISEMDNTGQSLIREEEKIMEILEDKEKKKKEDKTKEMKEGSKKEKREEKNKKKMK